VSSYLADEIRQAIELSPAQQAIRLMEIAVMVQRMESTLDGIVENARDEEQSLDALIARCNR
jgi:hypothetical protein